MNMIDFVHHFIVPAAYAVLPPEMNSLRATAMLLAIGLQESGFTARRQMPTGPARGFWQFERDGGLKGVATHTATSAHLRSALQELRYSWTPSNLSDLHLIIQHNDVVACACARLLLWTLPASLPHQDEAWEAWQQYLQAWRPGKPRPDEWPGNYDRAWSIVTEGF